MSKLTHIDESGAARMVDVGDKQDTERIVVASATVRMQAQTLSLLAEGGHKKGDVLAVARIAGIQGAKKCADLIPLCHPLMLNSVELDFELDRAQSCVRIEALTAVSVAALTIYDMCKAVDRGMEISGITLLHKEGGKSGTWTRDPQGDAS